MTINRPVILLIFLIRSMFASMPREYNGIIALVLRGATMLLTTGLVEGPRHPAEAVQVEIPYEALGDSPTRYDCNGDFL